MNHRDYNAHNHGFTGTNAAEPYRRTKAMRPETKHVITEMAVGLLCGIGFSACVVGLYYLLKGLGL